MFKDHNFTEIVSGTIERVTYFNPENGYSVLKITPDKNPNPDAVARDGTVTVVGVMPELAPGELAEFTGEWNENPRYGLQFKAEGVRPIQPTSIRGITRYLAESVSGVGPKIAERIVDHFGTETLDVLNRDPHRLREVKGLGERKTEELIEAWQEGHVERHAMIFLQGFGVSARFARRIYEVYQDDTIAVVRSNPYQLADEVYGIGFQKADDIAQEMGMDANAPERIEAGLSFALSRATQEGHTYLPEQVLIERTIELLKLEDNPAFVEEVMQRQIGNETLMLAGLAVDGDVMERAVYLPMYYYAEKRVAERLNTLRLDPSSRIATKDEAKDIDALVNSLKSAAGMNLTDQQRGAVRAALTNKVTVLTGGPGTGKTTTLKMVIEAVEALDRQVALAAPTGRAAKRLSEATDRPASTIHRLLGFQPGEFAFEFDDDNPLEIDMLVVDETSMLDLMLFNHLLKAIPPYAHLMLVGDADQLPSVGAGNVLHDVIASSIAHVTRLARIFRQDQRSHIVANAHSINQGEIPYLGNDSDDFFFFRVPDAQRAAEMVVDVVVNRIPEKFGHDPMSQIQVLSPMYRGPAGVNLLNRELQNRLNSNADDRLAEVELHHRIYRVNDKVMQTRNDYDKNVFNGDAGTIKAIDDSESQLYVIFNGEEQIYTYADAENLLLSYCISIHRSQGSEYPVVVVPVLTQHYMMLQRNLLYTAITRARELVVLVGTDRAVAIAVNNDDPSKRYSGLAPRLRSIEL